MCGACCTVPAVWYSTFPPWSVCPPGTMRYGCRIGGMFPGAIRHPHRALRQAWYVASSDHPTSPVSRRLPPAHMPAIGGHALRRYRLRKYQNRRSWPVPPTLPRRGSGCPRCLKLTLASSTSISRACRRARHGPRIPAIDHRSVNVCACRAAVRRRP